MTAQPDLRVSTWKLQAIGWVGVIFFSACAILSWYSGQAYVSPWFIPFILLSAPILLLTGPVTASPEALGLMTPLGRFEIRWREIESIEHGQSNILFLSGQKRLSIPIPEWWSGRDKQALLAVINSMVQDREIEIKQTFRADYLFPRQTKVD